MKRKLFTAMMLTSFLSTPLASFAAVDANTLPSLNNAINGAVTTSGNTMNAQVGVGAGQTAGAVAQFDWNHFNVGANGTVNWAFTNNNQTALNRVLGNNMSEIYGKLTNSCAAAGCTSYAGTGKVVLINPNGILFGDGSQVNLNSFTASTFDAVGAKNIKDLAGTAVTTYANSLNANFGPNVKVNFTGAADKIGALIKLDNSRFDVDKTLIILGKDVEIGNGSQIGTNLAYNYGSPTFNQNFSNVKIAAGNGAIVEYQKNGYANNESDTTKANFGFTANQGLAGVDYDLTVGSAAGAKSNITSGNIFIKNSGVKYGDNGSNIVVQNADLAGVKLVNSQLGEVNIVGNNLIDVKNSTISTYNTYETDNVNTKNTYSKAGGTVLINGEMGVDVDNVLIQTANSNAGTANAGDVTIKSRSGNISVNKSTIGSNGNVDVNAGVNANVTNTQIYAANTLGLDAKNISIKGENEVNVGNSTVAATGNVTLNSDKKINVYKGAGTDSIVYAGNTLNLHGAGTTITDTSLSYNNISLYEVGKVNDVTIKNNSTLEDRSANTTNGKGLVLNGNGKLTVDNNRLMKRNITFGVTTPATYTTAGQTDLVAQGTLTNQDKVTLNAVGDVSFINGSNVATPGDINATSTGGSVNILNNSHLNAGGNVNLTSNNSFIANSTIANANMDTTSSITGKNINIKTTGPNSDIDFNKAVLDKLTYSQRLKLDAARDVKISSPASLALNRADLIAGRSNNVTAVNDLTLNDVTMKAPNNYVTSTAGSIGINGVTLYPANSANPAATTTTFNANQNIITSTGTSLSANNTKVIMNAGKDINVKVNGVQNYDAGIEATGRYVNIDATDNVLAISRIVSDRLTLDANDKFIAAKTTLTASDKAGLDNPAAGTNPATPVGDPTGRAYIQVNEIGGFNLDNVASSIDVNGNYQGFYTGSYIPTSYTDGSGNSVAAYDKHFINLPGVSGDQKFLLDYTKAGLACAPGDDVPTDGSSSTDSGFSTFASSDLSNVRLPLQNEQIGAANISNNLTDLSSSIVAAAAGISLNDDDEENK